MLRRLNRQSCTIVIDRACGSVSSRLLVAVLCGVQLSVGSTMGGVVTSGPEKPGSYQLVDVRRSTLAEGNSRVTRDGESPRVVNADVVYRESARNAASAANQNTIVFFGSILPVVGTALSYEDAMRQSSSADDYVGLGLSLVGDATLFGGALARSGKAIGATAKMELAASSTGAAWNGVQVGRSLLEGDRTGAAQYGGLLVADLLGVELSRREINAIRSVSMQGDRAVRGAYDLTREELSRWEVDPAASRAAYSPILNMGAFPFRRSATNFEYDANKVPGPNPNGLMQRAVTEPTVGKGGVYLKPQDGKTKVGSTGDFRIRYGAAEQNGIEVEIPLTRTGPAADDSLYTWTARRQRRFDEEYVDRVTPVEARFRASHPKSPVDNDNWVKYRHIFGYGDLPDNFGE